MMFVCKEPLTQTNTRIHNHRHTWCVHKCVCMWALNQSSYCFLHAFCPSTQFAYQAMIFCVCVCVCVCVCKCVCLPMCCCLRVNLVFHSALHRSTSAAYVILGLCVCMRLTLLQTNERQRERGRAPTRQPAACVCLFVVVFCLLIRWSALWRCQ